MSSDGRWALSGSRDSTLRLWELDWELEAVEPAEWDDGARRHLESFLTLHTPYAAALPQDREPTEEEVSLALTREGKPTRTDDDFKQLLYTLGCAGYGWLRPEGVKRELERMAADWHDPPDLFAGDADFGQEAPPATMQGTVSPTVQLESNETKSLGKTADAKRSRTPGDIAGAKGVEAEIRWLEENTGDSHSPEQQVPSKEERHPFEVAVWAGNEYAKICRAGGLRVWTPKSGGTEEFPPLQEESLVAVIWVYFVSDSDVDIWRRLVKDYPNIRLLFCASTVGGSVEDELETVASELGRKEAVPVGWYWLDHHYSKPTKDAFLDLVRSLLPTSPKEVPKEDVPATRTVSETRLEVEADCRERGCEIKERLRPDYKFLVTLGRKGGVLTALAEAPYSDKQVVLQTLESWRFRGEAIPERELRRWRECASLYRSLDHPGLTQFNQMFEHEGRPFLEMEYVDGLSLQDYLDRCIDPLPLPVAVKIAMEILDSVAFLHEHSVVDTKLDPERVWLPFPLGAGRARLPLWELYRGNAVQIFHLDVDRHNPDEDAPDYRYMARENVVNYRRQRPASDVFSVGAITYRMMTGRYNRDYLGGVDIGKQVLLKPLVPVLERDPSTPVPIAEVVDKALSKEATDRYQSAKEMLEAFRAAADRCGLLNATLPAIPQPTESVTTRPSARPIETKPPPGPAGSSSDEINKKPREEAPQGASPKTTEYMTTTEVEVAVWAGVEYADVCEKAGLRVWKKGCENPESLPPFQEAPLVALLFHSFVTDIVIARWTRLIKRFPRLSIVFCYSTLGDSPDKELSNICRQFPSRDVPAFEMYFVDDMEPDGRSLVEAVKRVLGIPGPKPDGDVVRTSVVEKTIPANDQVENVTLRAEVQKEEEKGKHEEEDMAQLLKRMLEKAAAKPLPQIPGYEVTRKVGGDGFGDVFLGRQIASRRAVWLKVYGKNTSALHKRLAVLEREIVDRLTPPHTNVIAHLDYGEIDGGLWTAMENISGLNLEKHRVEKGGKLPLDEVLSMAMPLFDGLDYLHRKGFVHRDIKPGNIELQNTGSGWRPVITCLDMGTFFEGERPPELRERPGICAGTPLFMPREQMIDFVNAKPGVDLFAAGATIYNLLTGKFVRDFPRGSDPWKIALTKPTVPIREREPNIPPVLAAVIDKALSKDAKDRYQSAGEMSEVLKVAAEQCGFKLEDRQKARKALRRPRGGDWREQSIELPGYATGREILRDGSSIVREARRAEDGRPVMVQYVRPNRAMNAREVQRFMRSCELLQRLDHPNIVKYIECGQHEGFLWLAMDYIAGGLNMADNLQAEGIVLPLGARVALALPLLDGLEFLHENKVVHGDIRPGSIMLASDRDRLRPVIAGFEAESFLRRGCDTQGHGIRADSLGSLPFMPREQIIDVRSTGPATDIFAVAATLYHILTGKFIRDFARNENQMIRQAVQDPPIPIRDRDSSIPPPVAEIIDKALSWERKDRYQSAAEMHDALATAVKQCGLLIEELQSNKASEMLACLERCRDLLGQGREDAARQVIEESLPKAGRDSTSDLGRGILGIFESRLDAEREIVWVHGDVGFALACTVAYPFDLDGNNLSPSQVVGSPSEAWGKYNAPDCPYGLYVHSPNAEGVSLLPLVLAPGNDTLIFRQEGGNMLVVDYNGQILSVDKSEPQRTGETSASGRGGMKPPASGLANTQLLEPESPVATPFATAFENVESFQEWNVGDVVANRYEVKAILGEGGFARVFRVFDRVRRHDIAVKQPRIEMLNTEEDKERFSRLYRLWEALGQHPHIIGLYGLETHGGVPHAFMECVEGGSLKEWIDGGRLYEGGHGEALKQILDIAIQVGWALEFLHKNRIVHQDLKPANIVMTIEGQARSSGFSLAQRAREIAGTADGDPADLQVHYEGMTPAYCSPEQAYAGAEREVARVNSEASITQRTDIYSWAVLVFEMFNGELTWSIGPGVSQALDIHLEDGPAEAQLPRMPEQLARVLRHCLEESPSARPSSAREVVEILKSIYHSETGSSYPRKDPAI